MPEMDEATTRRTALVWHLVHTGVLRDVRVRGAMLAVPRHLFLPGESLARAYADDAVATKRTADGVAISSASQPAMVALMLEQLAVQPGMRVLEIGAGTGYNAALLRALVGDAGRVTTVDIDADITDGVKRHLEAAGVTGVRIVTADGASGHAPDAPYDRVILTVGAGDIAPAWVEHLTPNGLLVLPLRIGAGQFAVAFAREGNQLRSRSVLPCGFMPLRGAMDDRERVYTAANLRLTAPAGVMLDMESVAALLRTPPERRTLAVATGWQGLNALALAGQGLVSASSGDARYGFEGSGYGYFAPDGTSACILAASEQRRGSFDTALVYGTAATADRLDAALAAWREAGAPEPEAFTIIAAPLDAPAPQDAATVTLTHWRLFVAPTASQAP